MSSVDAKTELLVSPMVGGFRGVGFILICAVLFWLIYRIRLRQVTARMRRKFYTCLNERIGVARDRNDRFIQGIQGLLLRCNTAASLLKEGEPALVILDDVLQQSDRVMLDAREFMIELQTALRDPEYFVKGESFMNNTEEKSVDSTRMIREELIVAPTDLGTSASTNIAGSMNAILADVFALYLKTKNFHWHMSGPHFRDYHLLLDEQGDQLFAMTDPMAERIRKTGGRTIRSIAHIGKLQRVTDNDAEYVDPLDMLAELREDNQTLAARLREVHSVMDELRDIATASLIENWIDETERRAWFLYEVCRV
jgi:starvation-inducible DNA-binding protein